MATLDDVLITAELARRPRRPTDYDAENRALDALARALAHAPATILERLVETAMALCRAGSAGISLLEEHQGQPVFRWHAVAGAHARHANAVTPRDASPCGVVIARGATQLLAHPGRYFAPLADVAPPITEALLVPFFIEKQPVGTLCLLAHDAGRSFDLEDVRMMENLGEFCAAAVRVVRSLDAASELARVNEVIAAQQAAREGLEARVRSDRQRVEEALRESEERYHLLVENARDYAIFMVDTEGHVATWNSGAARILGYRAEEIVGRPCAVIFTPEDQARGAPERERRTAAREGRAEDERWHVRKDGTRFWGSGVMTLLRDAAGRPRGFAKILRDNTGRKLADEAREQARALAEAANRAKDEFLATVSHELRTPLAAMELWVHVLRTGSPGNRARAIDAIEQSARTQRKLISDLLDLSRALTGKLQLELEPLDLRRTVASALQTLQSEAAARAVHLVFSARDDAGGPVRVRGDHDRLQQVVVNLVSNAIKFSSAGGRVEVVISRDGDGAARVAVRDQGRGISPAFLPHVFAAFRQEDASSTRAHGGLGLGLAIVRQIVELHGGGVTAESAGEGQGATFTLTLPALDDAADAREAGGGDEGVAPSDAPLHGVHVLLVEDDELMRAGTTLVLEQSGARVTAAGSARDALDALAREPALDVIVSDVAMPGEDGYALLRAARARGSRVPAAALTGHARAEDRRRALDAGFDEHVAKPIEPIELVALVARLAGVAARQA